MSPNTIALFLLLSRPATGSTLAIQFERPDGRDVFTLEDLFDWIENNYPGWVFITTGNGTEVEKICWEIP